VDGNVIRPGLSDHFILTAKISFHANKNRSKYTLKAYNEVHLGSFQHILQEIKHKLSDLNDVNTIWEFFTAGLREAVNKYVPKKTRRSSNDAELMRFNQDSKKKQLKSSDPYITDLKTGDLFDHKLYAQHRKQAKKNMRQHKKAYLESCICKPLAEGNCRPFYKHLKGMRTSKQLIRLTKPNNSSTDDAVECADILNNHFHKQFNSGHQLQKLPKTHANEPTTYIEIEGVKKLLAGPKNGRAPGPD